MGDLHLPDARREESFPILVERKHLIMRFRVYTACHVSEKRRSEDHRPESCDRCAVEICLR